jgi:hypothetical protein
MKMLFIKTSFQMGMTITLQTNWSVVLLYLNVHICQEKYVDALKSDKRRKREPKEN